MARSSVRRLKQAQRRETGTTPTGGMTPSLPALCKERGAQRLYLLTVVTAPEGLERLSVERIVAASGKS